MPEAAPDRIVVVGAGFSGLAVTHHLRRIVASANARTEVLCLEGSSRAGGNIRTSREEDLVCEWGPNGFLDNEPATLKLVEELGLGRRLQRSDAAAARRFVFRAGALHPVPTGPLAFLSSGVLGWGGKLRLLAEPLIRPRRDGADESVFDFAARRIGRQAASVLVDAMVSGVYAGDARRLSLGSTFPKMQALERDHGGLFRGMLARRRSPQDGGGGPAGPGGTLTSFDGGMQTLIDGLVAACDDSLRLGSPVARVSAMGVRGYRVQLEEGAPVDAGRVVFACPAWAAAPLVRGIDADLGRALAAIPGAPVAVVHLAFERNGLGHDLDGFGFLVPRGQGPRILGCLWTSSIFPGRAGARRALLTCMLGGAHDPGALELDDEQLVATSLGDLAHTMGIVAAPVRSFVYRHPRGIPQYTLGHADRLDAIDRGLATHPGLAVCGNSYHGVSVNACAAEAPAVARRVVSS